MCFFFRFPPRMSPRPLLLSRKKLVPYSPANRRTAKYHTSSRTHTSYNVNISWQIFFILNHLACTNGTQTFENSVSQKSLLRLGPDGVLPRITRVVHSGTERKIAQKFKQTCILLHVLWLSLKNNKPFSISDVFRHKVMRLETLLSQRTYNFMLSAVLL